MEDLVFLRELIRTPESTCFPLSVNRVFPRLWLEELLGCVITRDPPPCNPIAIALPLNLLWVKSINARTRAGKDVAWFGKWYIRRPNTIIHLDVAPSDFNPFRNAMDRTYVLARQTSTKLKVPDRDAHARRSRPSAGTGFPHKNKHSSRPSRSPRAQRRIHIGATPSSQSLLVRGLMSNRSPETIRVASKHHNQNMVGGIFVR